MAWPTSEAEWQYRLDQAHEAYGYATQHHESAARVFAAASLTDKVNINVARQNLFACAYNYVDVHERLLKTKNAYEAWKQTAKS